MNIEIGKEWYYFGISIIHWKHAISWGDKNGWYFWIGIGRPKWGLYKEIRIWTDKNQL